MEEKDLPFVLEIERLSFSIPWPETSFKGEIENYPISNPYVIIYKPQNKVIGHIIYWRVQSEVQISNVAIHPDFRRMGIGRSVLEEVLSHVKKQGVQFVVLEVRPSNFVARSLYNKLGFKVIGIRKNYYHQPNEDALVMRKNLV
ncbi:MAG: ribosomal protein S18-alanine N-acetyltransferase [Acidobacteriota bacterium]|nr:ribosomal protein S18-alanine N-acetyltransferase [Acidobacteriota bacterium]